MLAMGVASSVAASTVLEMTPAELVSGASAILSGVAVGQDTYEVNGNVWTTTRFEVDEVLKGTPTSEYSITQYGGSRGNIRYAAPGLANLQIGEKYLLILDNTPSITAVRGLFQGLFRVQGAQVSDAFGRPVYWRGSEVPLLRSEGLSPRASDSLEAANSPESFWSLRARILALIHDNVQPPSPDYGKLASPPTSSVDGIGVDDFALIECRAGTGTPVKGWETSQLAVESLASLGNFGPGKQWTDALVAAVDDWNSVSGVFQISLSVGSSSDESWDDGRNTVGFSTTVRGYDWPTNLLGIALLAIDSSSCYIVEADILLNSNLPWSSNGSPSGYDFQSLAGHELGHALGLDHPNGVTSNAIMLTFVLYPGATIRVQQSDRNGLLYLYDPTVRPDLVITSLRADTLTMLGNNITISATAQNVGRARATPFRIRFYLSPDATISRSDTPIGACSITVKLSIGSSTSCNTIAPLSFDLAPGTYYLGALADYDDKVRELDEGNNSRIADTGVITIKPASPDLVVASLQSWNYSPTAGGLFEVTELSVKNIGTAAAGEFRAAVYFSRDSFIRITDSFSNFSCTFQTLAPGETASCSGMITLPSSLSPAPYWFGAIADDLGRVVEFSETNNTYSAGEYPLGPLGPNLVITSLRAGNSSVPGGILPVQQISLWNIGSSAAGAFRVGVYLYHPSSLFVGNLGMTCNIGGLAAGSVTSCAGNFTVPGTLSAGTYELRARADDLGQVTESDDNNNVRLADSGRVVLASGNTPQIGFDGVVNAASFMPGIAAGFIATVFGSRLSNVTGTVLASSTPLPSSLAGTSVRVNGILAPLFAIVNQSGTEQIHFQVPWEIASGFSSSFTVQVVVDNNGTTSAPANVTVSVWHPGFFMLDSSYGIFVHSATGELVSPQNPARRGETLVTYINGLGPVTNRPATGEVAPSSPLSQTRETVGVFVAGVLARTLLSGLAPSFVGLYQVNFEVPVGITSGNLDVIIGGLPTPHESKPVKLTIQ